MSRQSVANYEQKFFLNNQGISGIQNVSMNYSANEVPINILGVGFASSIYNGPPQGQISLDRDILYQDPVLNYTGEIPVSGTLVYDNDLKVIGFNSGYLTNYSVDCRINQSPTVSCNFVSFGEFGSGIRNGSLDYSGTISPINYLTAANQGSIFAEISGSGTNRVVGISQNLSIQREPMYNLREGQSNIPAQVITKYPIEVETNLTIEIDDLDVAGMVDNIMSGNYERLQLRIKEAGRQSLAIHDHLGDTLDDGNDLALTDNGPRTLYEFLSVTGKRVSQKVSSSANGVLKVDLGFVDYLK